MKELLDVIAKALVSNPDQVQITQREKEDGTIVLELRVAEEDMGKVIGKQGRIAKSIRSVIKAKALRDGKRVLVDII